MRVRLYASGVGYFERRGRLHSEADTLPVPTSHLDDALKSLVLLSPHGQLGSVTFASRLSPAVARARAGLPAEEGESLSYDRLLASLRGEQVEARVHEQSLRGRLVEVVAVGPSHPSYEHDSKPRPEDAAEEPEVLQVLLLSDSGALVRFDARELTSLKPLSPMVVERLEAALAAHLSLRSGRPQALTLGAHAGEELALAYLAEAPVWRPSYRLLLDDEEPDTARLQAWALVHNDTDEAWSGVAVELANGEPESFLFPRARRTAAHAQGQKPRTGRRAHPQTCRPRTGAARSDANEPRTRQAQLRSIKMRGSGRGIRAGLFLEIVGRLDTASLASGILKLQRLV
ncbi:MAG: hypothetical protein RLZZ450_2362 [Pseudomonadota bacterium]